MILHILRALFVLLMAAIGWFYLGNPQSLGVNAWMVMPITLTVGVLFVCIDILSPRRKLAVFSGAILGLMVGVAIAYALSFVVTLVVDVAPLDSTMPAARRDLIVEVLNLTIGTICCYFSISFILQTRDDFRFIIPYVEFAKQQKGPRAMLLDTSVLIDGRIVDIAATGILESQMVIPSFVVNELHSLADSADKLKRGRGRRGLDMVAKLRANNALDVKFFEVPYMDGVDVGVDQKLMRLAKELTARVVTNDYNLNKVAQLGGVDVININDLAGALKPIVLPGEKMTVRLSRAGEEPGQGVGFLDDGTMVVVEQGKPHLSEEVEFVVSRVLQTSAGRMIFGKLNGDGAADSSSTPRRGRSQTDVPAAS
jgi:uncharacterized protein YacL